MRKIFCDICGGEIKDTSTPGEEIFTLTRDSDELLDHVNELQVIVKIQGTAIDRDGLETPIEDVCCACLKATVKHSWWLLDGEEGQDGEEEARPVLQTNPA